MTEPTKDDHPLLQLTWWLAEHMTAKRLRPRKSLFGKWKDLLKSCREIIAQCRKLRDRSRGDSTIQRTLSLAILQQRQNEWIDAAAKRRKKEHL